MTRLSFGEGCWLAKRRHYLSINGVRAESVIAHGTQEAMQALVDMNNEAYQSDNYYIEKWDKEKFDWPSFPDLTEYLDLLD